jgi:hypothetical protein
MQALGARSFECSTILVTDFKVSDFETHLSVRADFKVSDFETHLSLTCQGISILLARAKEARSPTSPLLLLPCQAIL